MSGEPSSVQITEIEWRPIINDEVYTSDHIIAGAGYPFQNPTALIKATSFIKMARGTPSDFATQSARRHLDHIQENCPEFVDAPVINAETAVSPYEKHDFYISFCKQTAFFRALLSHSEGRSCHTLRGAPVTL